MEAALATERARREAAERSLQEARATLRDLETQLGHAELARREGSEAARATQDSVLHASTRLMAYPHIAEHGRMAWQKASGYPTRARAEAAIGRFKQVIGDGLHSRTV